MEEGYGGEKFKPDGKHPETIRKEQKEKLVPRLGQTEKDVPLHYGPYGLTRTSETGMRLLGECHVEL